MPEPTQSSAVVGFTFDDGIAIAQALGTAATLINPALAGGVAALTGIGQLLSNTVLPAIKRAHEEQISIAEQARIAAESALLRAQVGAPPAAQN